MLSRLVTSIDYAADEVVFFDPEAVAEANAALGPPDHAIPFRLRRGALIELDGSIDGVAEIPFIFDVGSPVTFLNAGAAGRLGIDVRRDPERPRVEGCGAEVTAAIEPGRVERLRFATLCFERPRLHVIDLPVFDTLGFDGSPAGILGNDLLDGRRVAIDYGSLELRVWQPRGAGSASPVAVAS